MLNQPPKQEILTKVFSTSGPNLVALAWTGDELSRRQAQNGVNFDFEVKFDLECQGQSHPKTIGILTKVFYIYGPNLVILAETGHELSRGQARDWHTDGHTHTHTDAGNDNTRRPILASGKNRAQSWWDMLYFRTSRYDATLWNTIIITVYYMGFLSPKKNKWTRCMCFLVKYHLKPMHIPWIRKASVSAIQNLINEMYLH